MVEDSSSEARAEVERASQHYYFTRTQLGIDARTKALVTERCLPWVRGPRVLDLGFVEGAWTAQLLRLGHEVDIVEGAERHVAVARQQHGDNPKVRVFHQLFQDFEADATYDTIVAGDMIRYLPDPQEFLRRARAWLNPGGTLLVTVPNRRSFHRRLGAVMGLEASADVPNARDQEVGNRRSYDRDELREVLKASGFKVEAVHGVFFKPLSSAQMDGWSDELLRGFLQMGDDLEEYAWFLWAAAQPEPE